MTHVRSRSTAPIMSDQGAQMFYSGIFFNPPCEYFLWEETGIPGKTPRLSVEH
jgi:hypothetical protein